MTKTKETMELERLLFSCSGKTMGKFSCFEVTFGNRSAGPKDTERVDYVTYENFGNVFRCYEIKVSKADFMSSAKKSFIGDFNYFVMPTALWEQLIREENKLLNKYLFRGVGVVIPNSRNTKLEVIRKAKRNTVALYDKVHMIESMMKSMSRYVRLED
ncbi:hypothetical protein ACFSJM_08840 [Lactococcus formosensis subsp. bovis]|uniref:hypothetical protein n=1 Tax=Lactococcus formosensis TaxID=1281486 RepID=UPI001BCE7B09|nr:hypothetical protein [Lactococcus formosensis]